MTKYREYFLKMVEDNKELFGAFRKIHDAYSLNPDELQEKYNKEGEKILEVVREYERRLCANTERGMYSRYSEGLADKFQNEIRKHYPMIDSIGIIVEKFSIKKIHFN